MRRLLLLFVLVPTFSWVFWASCQSDDYRDTLPFRVFDAAPREAGPPVSPPDMLGLPGDMVSAPRDQGPADLPPKTDGGAGDAGTSDGGGSSDGGGDAGTSDAGTADGGGIDGGTRD